MTSDKTVDNKTRTTSTSLAETLLGGNLCCFYYRKVVKQNKQYGDKPFFRRTVKPLTEFVELAPLMRPAQVRVELDDEPGVALAFAMSIAMDRLGWPNRPTA